MRWQAVLTALGVRSNLGRLINHYLAGQFVSNVLPTTIGGDVLRVARLSRENGESPASFASVVLERLTGWLVLPVLTYVGFVVNPGLTHLGTATRVALALATATLVLLVVVLLLVASHRVRRPLRRQRGLAALRRRRAPRPRAAAPPPGRRRQRPRRRASPTSSSSCSPPSSRPRPSAWASRSGPPRCSPSSPPSPSPRCCPSASPGSASARVPSSSSSRPSACPTEQAVALGLLLYLLNLGVSLLGAPAFAFGGRGPAAAVTPQWRDRGRATPDAPSRPRLRWWREVLYVGVIYIVYSTVRNQFGSNGGPPGQSNRHRLRARPRHHRRSRTPSASSSSGRSSAGTSTSRPTASSASGTSSTAPPTSSSPPSPSSGCYRRAKDRYPLWRNTLAFTTALRPHRVRQLQPHAARACSTAPAPGDVRTAGRAERRARLRLRGHPGHLRHVLVVRLRDAQGRVQPVRRHAEPARRLVDVVGPGAGPDGAAALVEGARVAPPGRHRCSASW